MEHGTTIHRLYSSHNYCPVTTPRWGRIGLYKVFDSVFQYLRCNSCWRPHFIVFRFLHAPILEGRRWFNFKNVWRHLIVELTGQSPASPGINYVASYFQRISCSCSADDTRAFITTKTTQLKTVLVAEADRV